MTTPDPTGYPAYGSTGWGCMLEMYIKTKSDDGSTPPKSDPELLYFNPDNDWKLEKLGPLPDGEAVLIGFIRPPGISIEMNTMEEDVTPPWASFAQFARGPVATTISCNCIYHPDLANWYYAEKNQADAVSVLNQCLQRETREFRLSIPVASHAWYYYKFSAQVSRLRIAMPLDDLMNVDLELRMTGTFLPDDLHAPGQITPVTGWYPMWPKQITPWHRDSYEPVSPIPAPIAPDPFDPIDT